MRESKILYPSPVLSQYIKYYWALKTDEDVYKRQALVIPEEVLPGDAYRISIGGAGVTGEKEEVPGDDM